MTPERRKRACKFIKAAVNLTAWANGTPANTLAREVAGQVPGTPDEVAQAAADAYTIGQAEDVPSPLEPIPMRIVCPRCCALHLDEGEFATRPHHTHACQECGEVWRPAVVATVGVKFLPGFKS